METKSNIDLKEYLLVLKERGETMSVADLTGTSWKFGNTILPTTIDTTKQFSVKG